MVLKLNVALHVSVNSVLFRDVIETAKMNEVLDPNTSTE